jgi:hypothetical protein
MTAKITQPRSEKLRFKDRIIPKPKYLPTTLYSLSVKGVMNDLFPKNIINFFLTRSITNWL